MDRELTFITTVSAALVAAIAALGLVASNISCHSRWGQAGVNVRWTVLAGCLVQPPGRTGWIPADNYREID